MKRIIIFIIAFCSCIVGYTQDPIVKFEKKLTITLDADSIKKDTIIWRLKGLNVDQILEEHQSDFTDKDKKTIVEVSRKKEEKEIWFIFKIDSITEDYKAILQEGITLIPDSVKVVFQIDNKVKGENAAVDSLEISQQMIANDNVIIIPEHQEIWYIIAGLGLILIAAIINLIVSMKIKNTISQKADANTLSKIGYDDTSLKEETKQLSTDIANLESKLSEIIEKKIFVLQENINSKLEEVTLLSDEQLSEKEDELPPVIVEKEVFKGYVSTPIHDYIENNDIKQDYTEYCIYIVQFITKDKANYYINTAPEALQAITNVATMLRGFSDETNGNKPTEVRTDECGELQRNGNRWKVVKPLKFTIK